MTEDDKHEMDLEVVDVQSLAVTADASGDAMLSLEVEGGQVLNLMFSPETLAKLEGFLATANVAQAKTAAKH